MATRPPHNDSNNSQGCCTWRVNSPLRCEKHAAGLKNIWNTRLSCNAQTLMTILLVAQQQESIEHVRESKHLADAGDQPTAKIGVNLSGKDLPCNSESIIH